MLSKPTLLIVGAGASAEIGFPVGTALRDQISSLLNLEFHGVEFGGQDIEFGDFLSNWASTQGHSHHDVWKAATDVSRALPLASSIDAYLDSHRGSPLRSFCGKAAIARLISQAENRSALSCNDDRQAAQFDFRPIANTWYQRLWAILQTGVTPLQPQESLRNLSIVTFNYDRNIERFLQFALTHFFDVSLDQAMKMVEGLNIVHVYGSLGNLQAHPDICPSFRSNRGMFDIAAAANLISTYTDKLHSELVGQIRGLVKSSERLVFLGFSFASQNMQLLRNAVDDLEIQREVYATTFGLSDEAIQLTRSQLDSLFSRGHSLARLQRDQAVGLFDRYPGVFG